MVGKAGVNAELSRNWLSKEQLAPAMERTYFQIKEEQVQTREVLVKRWGRHEVQILPRRARVAGPHSLGMQRAVLHELQGAT